MKYFINPHVGANIKQIIFQSCETPNANRIYHIILIYFHYNVHTYANGSTVGNAIDHQLIKMYPNTGDRVGGPATYQMINYLNAFILSLDFCFNFLLFSSFPS